MSACKDSVATCILVPTIGKASKRLQKSAPQSFKSVPARRRRNLTGPGTMSKRSGRSCEEIKLWPLMNADERGLFDSSSEASASLRLRLRKLRSRPREYPLADRRGSVGFVKVGAVRGFRPEARKH